MGLSKESLIFDPTELLDSDNVGAFLRSSDGTLLTHTSIGGKEALDVNIMNGISVDIDAASDSVQSWVRDGSGNSITSTSGALDVHFTNTTIEVSSSDLDIRDLSHLQDSVKVGDGTNLLAVNADGSLNVSSASPLDVQGSDFDIRDLTHASDSIRLGDGTNLSAVTANSDLQVVDRATTAASSGSATIGDTPASLISSPLANRKEVLIQNRANTALEVGPSGFTNGVIIPAQSSMTLKIGPGIVIEGKRESGKSGDVRWLQLA